MKALRYSAMATATIGLVALVLITISLVSFPAAYAASYEEARWDAKQQLKRLDLEGVRAAWAEWVRIALSSAGHIDPVNLDDMVRRIGSDIATAIRIVACPDNLNGPVLESVARKAAETSIKAKQNRRIPDEDIARVAVASSELVLRTRPQACESDKLERLLSP